MLRPPGSIERIPSYNMTFKAPIHEMLAAKDIKRTGPRRFQVTASEDIEIESNGRTMMVLNPGNHFYSITWDWEQPLHNCRVDYSVRT